ncbi:hypothetical protein [Kribbella sp. NPDC051770]|uniref:hypothetical protein n=1 Tax=Kribbella sp. NPDC051770 TaxID=3155413 RepID=UPI00342777DE
MERLQLEYERHVERLQLGYERRVDRRGRRLAGGAQAHTRNRAPKPEHQRRPAASAAAVGLVPRPAFAFGLAGVGARLVGLGACRAGGWGYALVVREAAEVRHLGEELFGRADFLDGNRG